MDAECVFVASDIVGSTHHSVALVTLAAIHVTGSVLHADNDSEDRYGYAMEAI
jgi:hypothetical protein